MRKFIFYFYGALSFLKVIIFIFDFLPLTIIFMIFFFQWGVAYCVRGGPEKEKLAMQVKLFFSLYDSIYEFLSNWILGYDIPFVILAFEKIAYAIHKLSPTKIVFS